MIDKNFPRKDPFAGPPHYGISPEMTEAGKKALSEVFSEPTFAKHDIVNRIYWAMRKLER